MSANGKNGPNGNGSGHIHVEEEEMANEEQQTWSEEFTVAADEIIATIKKIVKETNVRRIVIKNEARDVRFEIPFLAGVAGVALWPMYAALGLIVGWVFEFSVLVERTADGEAEAETAEKEPESVSEQ